MPRIQKLENATNFIQPFFGLGLRYTIMHNFHQPITLLIVRKELGLSRSVCRDAHWFQNQAVIQLLSIIPFYMQPQALSCTWP